MRAKTDSGPTAPGQEKSVEIQNLFTLMELVSAPDTVKYFEEKYADAGIRYGDMKKQLAEDIIAFVQPLRENILALDGDHKRLVEIARMGAEKAQDSARQTLAGVREIMGLRSLWS